MKKIYLTLAVLAIAGCSSLQDFNLLGSSSGTDSTQAKMHSCMLNEATSRFQAGTLFNNTIMATAKDISSSCIQKLALESMGISAQSQSDAVNIINSLKSLSNS